MEDTFIKTYDVFDAEWCDGVIDAFENSLAIGAAYQRSDDIRRDHQLEMNSMGSKTLPEGVTDAASYASIDLRNTEFAEQFFETLQKCVDDYNSELGLNHTVLGPTYFKNMLVQRSEADNFESYSTWHCEAGNTQSEDRVLTYLLYLNDDFEGGETEFMFQKHREKPKKGKLVLFPSYYTHTHRGGIVLDGTKYVATGWTFHIPVMN